MPMRGTANHRPDLFAVPTRLELTQTPETLESRSFSPKAGNYLTFSWLVQLPW